ncbi:MAG: SLOG family protein [Chloroflexia bacterium]
MKVIIAGSRNIADMNVDAAMIASGFKGSIDEVVSGGGSGASTSGEEWAKLSRLPIKMFPADWARFGKTADVKRNEQMAEYADALVLIWNGKSTGIRSLQQTAERHGLKIYVHEVA